MSDEFPWEVVICHQKSYKIGNHSPVASEVSFSFVLGLELDTFGFLQEENASFRFWFGLPVLDIWGGERHNRG